MPDLLGPSAFACDLPAAVRPPHSPSNVGFDTWFANCSNPATEDGTEVSAEILNAILAQSRAAIRAGGVTENNADDNMLMRAIRSQRANYLSAGGTGNAITIAPSPFFAGLADLVGVPLTFVSAAANTGPVTLSVNTMLAQPVTWPDGTPLEAGDIAGPGITATVRYDGAVFRLTLSPSPVRIRNLALHPLVLAVLDARYTVAGPLVASMVFDVAASTWGGTQVALGTPFGGTWNSATATFTFATARPNTSYFIEGNCVASRYIENGLNNEHVPIVEPIETGDIVTKTVNSFTMLQPVATSTSVGNPRRLRRYFYLRVYGY
jgi:hypothetical protein